MYLDNTLRSLSATQSRWTAWSQKQTDHLIALCKEGKLSAREIAKEMGLTRNSVIGKCRRMGLELPGSLYNDMGLTEEQKQERRNKLKRERRLRQPTVRRSILRIPRTHIDMATAFIDTQNLPRVELLELTEQTCRWPYGEAPDIKYCGDKPEEGLPYCAFHCCIAYQPAQPKSNKRAA